MVGTNRDVSAGLAESSRAREREPGCETAKKCNFIGILDELSSNL